MSRHRGVRRRRPVNCPRGHVATTMLQRPDYLPSCTGGPRAGGLTAAACGWRGVAQGLECATARSLSGPPNLAGFCREFGWIRDKAPNSGSYTPLASRVNHITKVSQETALQPLIDGPVWPASGIIPDAAQAQSITAYRPATAPPRGRHRRRARLLGVGSITIAARGVHLPRELKPVYRVPDHQILRRQ